MAFSLRAPAFAVVVATCLLGPACAAAADGKLMSAIKSTGATEFVELLGTADAIDAYTKHEAELGPNIAVLVPTNKAVNAWAKAQGLAMKDLSERRMLAKRIVSYLTLLPTTMDVSKLPVGAATTIKTANMDHWGVKILKTPDGKVTAVDSHGNIANVKPTSSPNVYVIDKMLVLGNIFDSLMQMDMPMEGTYAAPFTTFIAALERAGIADEFAKLGGTHFVPTDEALSKAGITLDSLEKRDPAELQKLLRYATLSGYKTFPQGFAATNGKPIPTTLKGYDVTVKLTPNGMQSTATVTDAVGNVANVVAPNYFVGRSTIHGIDSVLRFDTISGNIRAPGSSAAPAPAAAAAAAEPAPAAAPAAAAGPAPAAAAPAAAAEPASGKAASYKAAGFAGKLSSLTSVFHGRKMLAGGEGGGGGNALGASVYTQIAVNNAQDAIRASLNSDDPAAVARATSVNQINASYASFPTQSGFYYIGGNGGLNGRR